jgi:predicted enzyme related to lactoylglutathione lyase
MSIPNIGYVAYCQDTEGNIIGLFQADGSAT